MVVNPVAVRHLEPRPREAQAGLKGQAAKSLVWRIAVSLAEGLGKKDPATLAHSLRVMELSALIANAMGLPAEHIEQIKLGALLHDIGKGEIDDAILLKAGELSPDERDKINLHPLRGAWLLGAWGINDPVVREIVCHHHERVDGQGYYGKLPSLEARIITAADAYDVMTNDRPYAKAIGHEAAVAQLRRETDNKFDAEVVRALLAVVQAGIAFRSEPEIYPDEGTNRFGDFAMVMEIDSLARELARTAAGREVYVDADYLREQMPLFSRYFVNEDSELLLTLERGAKYEDIRLALVSQMGVEVEPFAEGRVSIFREQIQVKGQLDFELTADDEDLAAKLAGYLFPLLHDVGNLLVPAVQAFSAGMLRDMNMTETAEQEMARRISRLNRNFQGLREPVSAGRQTSQRTSGWLPILEEMKSDFEGLTRLLSEAEGGKFRLRFARASQEAADTLGSYLSLISSDDESAKLSVVSLKSLIELASCSEAVLSGSVETEVAVNLSMAKAVVRNLKGNARKAMNSQKIPADEQRIEVSARNVGARLVVEIRNPGQIPSELLAIDKTTGRQRIFNLGTSTGKKDGHEGRGGDIIHSFLKAQGATVKAENRGGMAVFTLVFPALTRERAAAAAA